MCSFRGNMSACHMLERMYAMKVCGTGLPVILLQQFCLTHYVNSSADGCGILGQVMVPHCAHSD